MEQCQTFDILKVVWAKLDKKSQKIGHKVRTY